MQHDCYTQKCTETGRIRVLQERELSDVTKAVVAHMESNFHVLNLADMGRRRVLAPFCGPTPTLNRDDIITRSVMAEIDARKVLGKKKSKASGGKKLGPQVNSGDTERVSALKRMSRLR